MSCIDRALADIGQILNNIKDTFHIDVFLISSRGRFIATTSQEGALKTKAIGETPYRELFGRFYAESLVLAETGNMTGAIQIAGTDADGEPIDSTTRHSNGRTHLHHIDVKECFDHIR